MTARIAPAVGTPALHSMNTTPGTVLDNLDRVFRRMPFQELAIVGKLREPGLLDVMQSVAQCHLAKMMMMPIALTIGCDVHQLRAFARIGKSTEQSLGNTFAIVQQTLEGHGLRNRTIIEKQIDLFLRP